MDGMQGKDQRQNHTAALEAPVTRAAWAPTVGDVTNKCGSLLLRFSADERHLLLNQY